MVSSITPNTAGATALGVDPRFQRNGVGQAQQQQREGAAVGDRVELSAASIAQSRESVRAGLMQIHEALAAGHEAQSMLVKLQTLAKTGGVDAQAEMKSTLAAFAERIEAAIARGATMLSGQAVTIQAEPGAAPVTIDGVDLTLKVTAGDVLAVTSDAQANDPALPEAVQRSLEKLQDAMSRLLESVRSLEAHQSFLGVAQSAAGVRTDLDADSARLLALQVRQGLEKTAAPIANVEPAAVLSLFRA